MPIKIEETNYCSDCGKEIGKNSTRCRICAAERKRIDCINDKQITRDELKKLIRTTPFIQIGKQFGVSDNAIRKWCKLFKLPSTLSDIKKYSDEEWELV